MEGYLQARALGYPAKLRRQYEQEVVLKHHDN
jgi:hypothetical protein